MNNEYVVLTDGLYDIGNVDVALNNVKTREEIEGMVNTQAVLDEMKSVVEQKTIELENEEYTDHILVIDQLGCVVTKDCFLRLSHEVPELKDRPHSVSSNEDKEVFSKVRLTKNDCLDDIIPIQFHYRPWNARVNEEGASFDVREEPDFIPYNSSIRFVHFNEFYNGILELGYDFERGDLGTENGFESPYDEYLDMISKGEWSNDVIVEDPEYYKSKGR